MSKSYQQFERMLKHQGKSLEAYLDLNKIKKNDFAEEIGISIGTLYSIFKDEIIDDEYLSKIKKAGHDFLSVQTNVQTQKEFRGNIIYVPLYAYGGFLGGYRQNVFIDQLEHFRLPGVTGTHYAFEIGGYSMMKPGHELSATPGDVAISRMEEEFKHMMKGKGYILQTIDGILYKIFDKIVGEKAYFLSLNEEYDGHSLPLKEIKRVYFVTFILKKTH